VAQRRASSYKGRKHVICEIRGSSLMSTVAIDVDVVVAVQPM
jgi:hypothetical protein